MSYTVEVPATVMGPTFSTYESSSRVYATTFWGGENGRMVQLSTGSASFACLTVEQLDALIDVLQHARKETLQTHPRYGDDA